MINISFKNKKNNELKIYTKGIEIALQMQRILYLAWRIIIGAEITVGVAIYHYRHLMSMSITFNVHIQNNLL